MYRKIQMILCFWLVLSAKTHKNQENTVTYHTIKKTWNEASEICKQNGGYLFNQNSTQKYNLLESLKGKEPWLSGVDIMADFWIGLYETEAGTYVWSDCVTLNASQHSSWHSASSLGKCVFSTGVQREGGWKLTTCNDINFYLCENINDPCDGSYDLSDCYNSQIDTSDSLIVNTNEVPTAGCLSISSVNNEEATSSAASPTVSSNTYPLTSIVKESTIDIQSTSETVLSSSLSLDVDTAANQYNSSFGTTTQIYGTPTPSQISSTIFTQSTPLLSVNATATTSSTSIAYCVCQCTSLVNFTLDDLAYKIAKTKLKLSVDKCKLSRTIRKTISVYDSRTSSKSIGYIGITILSIPFGILVIIDFINMATTKAVTVL